MSFRGKTSGDVVKYRLFSQCYGEKETNNTSKHSKVKEENNYSGEEVIFCFKTSGKEKIKNYKQKTRDKLSPLTNTSMSMCLVIDQELTVNFENQHITYTLVSYLLADN